MSGGFGLTALMMEDAQKKAEQNTTRFYLMWDREAIFQSGLADSLWRALTAEVTAHPNNNKPFYKVEIFSLLDKPQVAWILSDYLEKYGFFRTDAEGMDVILGPNAQAFIDKFINTDDYGLSLEAKELMRNEVAKTPIGVWSGKDRITSVKQDGKMITVLYKDGKAFYYLP